MSELRHTTLAAVFTMLASANCDAGTDDNPPIDSSSILRGGMVETLDPNGDNVLTQAEITQPEPEFYHKPICSEDIVLRWRACLMEDVDGELVPSNGFGARDACANFETRLDCNNYELSQGRTDCKSNYFCSMTIGGADRPMRCGWKITQLEAYNAWSGGLIERFDEDFVDELGFELLPIGPR